MLWVDIGAASRAEAERLGVALLDPVIPDRPMWTFADLVAGPAAGQRAGCAAVAATANATPARGETIFVLGRQSIFGNVGVASVVAAAGRIDSLAMLVEGGAARMDRRLARGAAPPPVGAALAADSFATFRPQVRFAGSFVESIDAAEIDRLRTWVASAAGVAAPPALVPLPADTVRALPPRADGFGGIERTFVKLADIAGVSNHEAAVREAVRAELPAWARQRAETDAAGNLIVAAGPERDTIVFLAHLDEVGFEVDRVMPDGRVTLRALGGVVLPSWEGVPALLHRDGAEPLRGVFVPRDTGRLRAPRALVAWFGVDSVTLVQQGVRRGQQVTAYKRAARLAGSRLTARGSDDRTGSTALLHALAAIDPARLPRRVLFVWTVQEETGLAGARAVAARVGPSVERVYSIDTFVSSDTPLETPHFAFTPLGAGPVVRGLDDGNFAPRAERERVLRIAAANGIAVQVGTTQGSTDGTAFTPWGATNLGLSWPGRYSHGPAEVLDLRDVQALVRLIAAVATAR
jgi:putative aminopeptidase FrvX